MNKIFNPKTVAVIGASNKEGSIGQALIKNMIGSGFEGVVYPISLTQKSIFGVRAYKTLEDTQDTIDLAIIAMPSDTIPEIVNNCGKYGVGGVVITTAGFMEAGDEGRKLVEKILLAGKKFGMRIIGPNCLGFIKPSIKLNASFSNKMALPGKIAFISQSGALCTAVLDWSVEKNVGFSHFVSIGSMIDVGFHDLIDFFGSDPETNSIVIYMESLTHTRKFMSAARAFARTKPIIVLKAGKTSQGSQAAMSHTGTLAGNEAAFEAAFKRAGIISVNSIEELFNASQALAMQPRPTGNRLAIITNAGGPGVLATDHLVKQGGDLAELSEQTIEKLNNILPSTWSHGNPIDVLGDAGADRYTAAVDVVLNGPNVDGILVILTPQAMTHSDEIAIALVKASKNTKKPILASWMGEKDVAEGRVILEQGNIPVYRNPESAVNTFMNMVKYHRNIRDLYQTPSAIPQQFRPKMFETREIIHGIIQENRFVLTEDEAKEVLSNYEIPITQNEIARTPEEAIKIAHRLGYPVVMKIASSDITHKSDSEGVVLNIKSDAHAKDAFDSILNNSKAFNPTARIAGVLVEQMINKKYELIIGSKKDPIFGPVLIFGMGGITVEVFKDLAVGIPPLNMSLAKSMIEETKIYQLLKGYRNMEPVDIEAIQFLLYKFSYLIMDFPEIKEIDINPYVVDKEGGVVLDAKIILDESYDINKELDYNHLIISRYPKHLSWDWELKDGLKVHVRPIKPTDEDLERELFQNLSRETQYFRFFGYVPNVTHDLLVRYTQIDYDRECALIALIEDEGKEKMAGVVRLVSDHEGETAEFAVVIADKWQSKGLGNKFLDTMLEIAKNRGLKKVYANVLSANVMMLYMFKKRGFKVKKTDEDSNYAELSLV